MMKAVLLGAALLCAVAGSVAAAPMPVASDVPVVAPPAVHDAQYNPRSPTFRRCMRAKYGPRYFSRVNRAHRWHMSQACMA
jgi:hypothetical protein